MLQSIAKTYLPYLPGNWVVLCMLARKPNSLDQINSFTSKSCLWWRKVRQARLIDTSCLRSCPFQWTLYLHIWHQVQSIQRSSLKSDSSAATQKTTQTSERCDCGASIHQLNKTVVYRQCKSEKDPARWNVLLTPAPHPSTIRQRCHQARPRNPTKTEQQLILNFPRECSPSNFAMYTTKM